MSKLKTTCSKGPATLTPPSRAPGGPQGLEQAPLCQARESDPPWVLGGSALAPESLGPQVKSTEMMRGVRTQAARV